MGHLKTLWTVFSVPHPLVDKHGHFGNPPLYPCRFSNDTPSALFKKKFTVQIYWNFKIQTYCKVFVEYLVPNTFILSLFIKLIQYLLIPDIKCKNVGIIIHMDRGLDPHRPCGQTWTFC